MTIESSETGDAFSSAPPRFFASLPYERLPLWLRGLLLAAIVAVGAFVTYVGATRYPDTRPPAGTELDRRVAEVFGAPVGQVDDNLTGDLLVERFYAVDVETGERYVADILKGRVRSIVSNERDATGTTHTLLLDLQEMARDRAFYAAYVTQVAPPDPSQGYYLGLRAAVGVSDGFPLNYDGYLPEKHAPFETSEGDGLLEFLRSQSINEVEPALINVGGYNYLLSSTAKFPSFRTDFGVRAIFVSELVLVDTTARKQAATYFRLLDQYQSAQVR